MGEHPAGNKYNKYRRAYMKGGLLPERIGLPHSVQKKQTAHISRVLQPVVTCCPDLWSELRVWAGGQAWSCVYAQGGCPRQREAGLSADRPSCH
jgi:hypothetical protein